MKTRHLHFTERSAENLVSLMLLGGCVQAAGRPQNGAGGEARRREVTVHCWEVILPQVLCGLKTHKSHLSLTLILKQPQVLGV